MLKQSKETIYFCGKERHFKRCPNKVLRDVSKPIEEIQNALLDKVTKVNELEVESQRLRFESNDLLNQEKVSPDDIKKSNKLIKEAKKIEEEAMEIGKTVNSEIDGINEKLDIEYGKVCELLLDPFEPGEFEANYDTVDKVIVKNISMFYDMYMTNTREAKIQERIRQLVAAEHESKVDFRAE